MATTNGSLCNAVNALKVQNGALANISQNLANSTSTGYKALDSQFSTILKQNYNDTSAYGVKLNTRTMARDQGIIIDTENPLDKAISGQGFFVVSSTADASGNIYYTRNGVSTLTPESDFNAGAAQGSTYLTDANGYFLLGYPGAASAGVSNSTSGLSAIKYDNQAVMDAKATSQATLGGTIPLSSSDTLTASISVYDSNGNLRSIPVTLTPTGVQNSWTVTFTPDPSTGVATSTATTLTFDSYGNVVSPTSGVNVSVAWTDGATNSVSVDLSKLGLNATGTDTTVYTQSQDGYPSGRFQSVSISDQGVVYTEYSNGQREAIATLAIAQFVEPNELAHVSGTMFSATREAGEVRIGSISSFPGQSALVTQALENSNVDINVEFSNMIVTQKAYSSASQLWGTINEMIQVARDLKSV